MHAQPGWTTNFDGYSVTVKKFNRFQSWQHALHMVRTTLLFKPDGPNFRERNQIWLTRYVTICNINSICNGQLVRLHNI